MKRIIIDLFFIIDVELVLSMNNENSGIVIRVIREIIPEQRREGKRTCLRLFISAPEERFIALATLTKGEYHHVTTYHPPVLSALACESYYSVSQVWQDSQPQTAQSSPL